jgi:hypothetical protein
VGLNQRPALRTDQLRSAKKEASRISSLRRHTAFMHPPSSPVSSTPAGLAAATATATAGPAAAAAAAASAAAGDALAALQERRRQLAAEERRVADEMRSAALAASEAQRRGRELSARHRALAGEQAGIEVQIAAQVNSRATSGLLFLDEHLLVCIAASGLGVHDLARLALVCRRMFLVKSVVVNGPPSGGGIARVATGTAEKGQSASHDAFLASQRPVRGSWKFHLDVRVRVEIMGPGKYENVGKSQSVLIVIY